MDVDFEVSDALEKLEGLGFLVNKDTRMTVRSLPEALSRLDTMWDRLYDFSTGESVAAGAVAAPASRRA